MEVQMEEVQWEDVEVQWEDVEEVRWKDVILEEANPLLKLEKTENPAKPENNEKHIENN
jgi:hypothetical protein